MPSLLRRRLPARTKPPIGSVLDRRHPLARSLNGLWLFQDSGVVDLTQLNARGSYNGSAVPSISPMGQAALTPGATTDYVSVPDSTYLNITGDITIWAWVLPAVLPGAYKSIMMKASGSASNQRQYGMGITSGDVWRCTFYANNTEYSCSSSITPSLTTPTLIAATHTAAGAIVFYVNGGVANSMASVVNPLQTFAVPLVWGRLGNDPSEAWNGRIIASGIHSCVLTAEEIRTLYAEPFAMIVPPTSTRQATPSAGAPATTGTADIHGLSQLAVIDNKGGVSVVSLRAEGREAIASAKQASATSSVRSQSRMAFVVAKAMSYTASMRGLAELTAPGTQGGVTTVGLRSEGRVATGATIKGGVSAPTHRAEGRLSIQSISERTSAAFYRALADLRITSTSGQTSTGAASLRGVARFAVTGVRGAISTVEVHSPGRGALASAKQLTTTVTMRAASRAATLITTARSSTAGIRSRPLFSSTGVTAVVEIILTVAASGQAIAQGIGSTLVQRFRNRVRYTLRNNPSQTSEYRNPPTGRDRDSTHRR